MIERYCMPWTCHAIGLAMDVKGNVVGLRLWLVFSVSEI